MKLLSNEKKTLRPLNRIGTGVRLTAFPKPEFFDTPTPKIANITYGFRAKAKLVQPEGYDPFMVQASASQQVKVVGHDDAVDEIITDESQRSLNESAWFNSRVVTSDKEYFVLLGFDNPPLAQAFTAWLLDGEQRYKLGQLFIPAHAPRQWYRLYRYRFIKRERWVLPEKVSVELVPDMTVVDKQLVHTAYWGKTMRRDHIIVDEPYKPAFNMDPVFADEVVNAVKISSLARFKSSAHSGETRLNVSVDRLHCRIAYQAIVFDDKQTYLDNMRLGFIHQKVGSESGHSTTIIIPNDVDQVHVRLIPADFWEIKGDLESPPWGYTLDFGILKLHDPKENRPRWLQGRVVWPDE
ncbi:MAG: hypothetical protein CMJ19_15545 [Phycisphaeraceae bacterium]|nr:hypothetical protein [Phycisphaeraceae bacterium]